MRRLALVVVGLALSLAAAVRPAAQATPFSDVPASHWAYQYIQTLAADGLIDGYPDGEFKGDRPLTRYEMAVVVARVVAKLQESGGTGASRADLDKLQKLIDALKDELDALGVRTTSVEDSVGALDRRTKFAQSVALHGVFLPNVTFRQRVVIPKTVTNTTGTPITTYYGTIVPGPANPAQPAVGAIDPFVNAFLTTDDSNDPLTQAPSGIQIRQDSRFSLAYAVSNNVTVSLPVHVLNFEYGGEFTQQAKFDVEPGVDFAVAHAGAISNLDVQFGIVDEMASSRTGLTFRAPAGYNDQAPYVEPYQPFQKGVSLRGTVGEGTFGLTDFQTSFTRLDDTLFNTQPGVVDPSVVPFEANQYFLPIVPPQATFTQSGAALRTDTFSSGSGILSQVYLTQKAQAGSVSVSAFGGALTAAPAFTYNDADNSVVFATPLPPGSTLSLSYRGLAVNFNASPQRYMMHLRANQSFKGLPGVEVGLSFNRIFGFDDAVISGSGATSLSQVYAAPVNSSGDISDTVLGFDFQAPLPLGTAAAGTQPVLFGEAATSTFSPDVRTLATVGDAAGLLGLRVNLRAVALSVQYQSVGTNFFDGAPFRYYGNAPDVFADYNAPYFPGFFGFANNLAINRQFDAQFPRVGRASPDAEGNPNLSFIFPMWNPLRASGPEFYSAFAPNTRGPTASIEAPGRLGAARFTVSGSYQHLEELAPRADGTLYFGPQYRPSRPERYDDYNVGTSFKLPVFGQQLTTNLSGSYETLRRSDAGVQQYYPIDPATGRFEPSAVADAKLAFPSGGNFGVGGSQVGFYPNDINVRRIAITAAAAVPITRDLTLGGSYSTQRYGGSYGTTLGQNISERKDYYTGSLTYAIPRTNSSVTFLTRRYNYFDDVVPNANLQENRQDVNFTVRF
ncbi:MAG: S-layer homology domain-containing protein [Candidatus Eremiobacteraeota bacterium]|nr:S-layer homology domain-containing protein [Candidatus Eremiobacteraeota bacterium]MBC5802830.1 S-layer homology domain-containing protein [Candidatus Eremiobacteraeota bacterium]